MAGVVTFGKLRVSLTRSCNFACVYCAADGKAVIDTQLTPPEKFITWITKILQVQPITKIRLTGGEPTLYPQLVQLVTELKKITTAEIYLTTNGHRLHALASPLAAAGLSGVNISLDAVEPEIFKSMGGRNYPSVIRGVRAANDAGLEVKINATLMAEMNDNQILPLIDFGYRHGIIVRFLELMAMGHLHGRIDRRLVTTEQILRAIRSHYEIVELGRKNFDTARYYQLERGQIFGIIANHSAPFCSDCDRLRLDALGRVYGCLSNLRGIPLDGAVDIDEVMRQAMTLKQRQKFIGSALVMREVGG